MFTDFLYLTYKCVIISATYGCVYVHVTWNPSQLNSHKFENNYKKDTGDTQRENNNTCFITWKNRHMKNN